MTEQTMAIWGIIAFLYILTLATHFAGNKSSKKEEKISVDKKRMKIKSLKYRVR